MSFIISIVIAVTGIMLLYNQLKMHEEVIYLCSLGISCIVVTVVWREMILSGILQKLILAVLARGSLAGALFIIVMITGALPNGTKLINKLMPIRRQLSIIACIFTFAHNAAYGKTYYRLLFTEPKNMPTTQLFAAICSVLMLIIMIPLFITSFRKIRKKLPAKKWKNIQRTAYLFYGLLFVHIMLLTIPNALNGKLSYIVTVGIYGTIFIWYFVCRIMKAAAIKNKSMNTLRKKEILVLVICTIVVLTATLTSKCKISSGEVEMTNQTGKYMDGEYEGKAFGNCSNITVKVTVQNDEIKDIEILSHGEDEPYMSDALYVIDDIISKNSTAVDVISGATYSSEGIIDAVKKALLQAERNSEEKE